MLNRFEPAQYSLQDLHFLLDHLGTPPIVAFRQPLPVGTHRNSLEDVLRSVYEMEELKKAEDGFQWAVIESLTDSITRYLEWHDRSREIARRGARDSSGSLISHPSMYAWDEDGRAFKFAVDADAADMVRTEIQADGSRRAFGVTLANVAGDTLPHISDIAPWVKLGPGKPRPADKVLDEKSEKNARVANLRCTICDFTQQYDPKVVQTRRLAMARMSKHMRDAKVNVNRHRVLLTKIGH
jgi:hypothetical protein